MMLKKDKYASDKGAWCGLNRPDLEVGETDAVIFGIPFDEGVSYRSGAAEGPSVLRQNTFSSSPFTESFESLGRFTVHDCGDFIADNRDALFGEVADYVRALVKEGTFFTAVGGDHSVTIPILRGIDAGLEEDFGIVHIDAHFDLCDTLEGDALSHGSVHRRSLELENISGTNNLFFVGIRSIEADEYEFKKNNLSQVYSAKACHRLGMDVVAKDAVEKMRKFKKVYITVDIDCLDPAFAAGTGTPQFGGLYSRQLLDLLESLFQELPVIGFDVVEVAPPLDPSLTSMFAARKIITECWGYQARKVGKLGE